MSARDLLLLVRHASAEERRFLGATDDDCRGLDGPGRRRFREHAERLRDLVKLDAIISSPLVRAVQTAEILAHAFDIDEVLISDALAPSAQAAANVAALARGQGKRYALVGHQPSLGEAATLLTAGGFASGFKKGAALALRSLDKACAEVVWMKAPE